MNYINAHATSTLVGDIAEVKAIKNVFSDRSHIKMNGTKSMIGHCLGAAAGIEAVATIKAIETGWVHPTINQVFSQTVPSQVYPFSLASCWTFTSILLCWTCTSLLRCCDPVIQSECVGCGDWHVCFGVDTIWVCCALESANMPGVYMAWKGHLWPKAHIVGPLVAD